MGKKEWKEWVMCNLLEIIILILVLILVINTFSKNTLQSTTQIGEKESKEEISAPQEGASAENQSNVLEQPQKEIQVIQPKENVSEELKGNGTSQVSKETIEQGVEKGSNTTK